MKTTQRGFAIYGELKDTKHQQIRVQESSSADQKSCWIFCKNHKDEEGWLEKSDGKIYTYSPHLNVEQAKELIEYLKDFVGDQ